MTLCFVPGFSRERTVAAITYIDGGWHDGNVPVIGAMSHAIWLGCIAFGGARALEGVTPIWIGTASAS